MNVQSLQELILSLQTISVSLDIITEFYPLTFLRHNSNKRLIAPAFIICITHVGIILEIPTVECKKFLNENLIEIKLQDKIVEILCKSSVTLNI